MRGQCGICKRSFEVKNYQIKRGDGKFCSKFCAAKNLSKIRISKNKIKRHRICKKCGVEFFFQYATCKGTRGFYCNKVCANRSLKRRPSLVGLS